LTIEHLVQSYSFNKPQDLLRQKSQRVDEMIRRLEQSIKNTLQVKQHDYGVASGRIGALDPVLILKRGFAIVKQDERSISTAASLRENRRATIDFHDGRAFAIIEKKEISADGKKRD
jgi:exodeoxyribonuclease VII large subunit